MNITFSTIPPSKKNSMVLFSAEVDGEHVVNEIFIGVLRFAYPPGDPIAVFIDNRAEIESVARKMIESHVTNPSGGATIGNVEVWDIYAPPERRMRYSPES